MSEGSGSGEQLVLARGVGLGRQLESARGVRLGGGGGEHIGRWMDNADAIPKKGASPEYGSPALGALPSNQADWEEGTGRGEYQPATDANLIA